MSEAKSAAGSLRSLLESTSVEGLIAAKGNGSKEMVTVASNTTVVEACHVLAKHGISSAPVYDPTDHAFKGMIDFRDVCTLVVKAYSHKGSEFGELLTPDVELRDIIKHGLVGLTPVSLVADMSSLNPLKGVHLKNSLLEVVSHFLENFHRVCVFQEAGAFSGVLSQSDVIRFLYEKHINKEISDPILGQSLSDLGLSSAEALTIDWTRPVLDAITLMVENKISSIALVEDGSVWGTLSISDVKYLARKNKFTHLKESCADFISSVRQYQSLEEHHGKDVYPVYHVSPSAKLSEVMGKLVATRTHRIFVTSPGKPIHVVSLTDILRLVANSS